MAIFSPKTSESFSNFPITMQLKTVLHVWKFCKFFLAKYFGLKWRCCCQKLASCIDPVFCKWIEFARIPVCSKVDPLSRLSQSLQPLNSDVGSAVSMEFLKINDTMNIIPSGLVVLSQQINYTCYCDGNLLIYSYKFNP